MIQESAIFTFLYKKKGITYCENDNLLFLQQIFIIFFLTLKPQTKRIMKKNKIATILATVFLTLTAAVVNAAPTPSQSILRLPATLKGAERLDAMYQYYNKATYMKSCDEEVKCLDLLVAECDRQKNIPMRAEYMSCYYYTYYNHGKTEELVKYVEETRGFMKEHQYWSHYYSGWVLVVKEYAYLGKFQTALHEVQQMYNDARANNNKFGLGQAAYLYGIIYAQLSRHSLAIKWFRYSISLLPEDVPDALMTAYDEYCNELNNIQKYRDVERVIPQWENILKRIAKKKGKNVKDDPYYMYESYICYEGAVAACRLNQLNKARYYIDEMKTLKNSLNNPSISDIETDYYMAKGDYATALRYNGLVLDYCYAQDTKSSVYTYLVEQAEIYGHLNRWQEAIQTYRTAINLKDSLDNASTISQINELQTLYKTDELKLEKRNMKNIIIGGASCCLLLILMLIGYIIHLRRVHAKNKIIYSAILARQKREDETEALAERMMTENHRSDGYQQMYNQLKKMIKEQELFKKADFSRDDAAILLGTNRTYLSDMLRQCSKAKSFSDFINGFRLRYAAKLLTETADKSVSEISDMSGFNSRSTFNANFRNVYGMTPSEFRTISVEKKFTE